MQNFKNLKVWQQTQELTVEIYSITRKFPREELFGLTSQMRRACTAIGANIAEGSKRCSPRDKAHFLNMAQGSAGEAISELDVATRLKYVSATAAERLDDRLDHIGAMLERLRQRVLSRATPGHGVRPGDERLTAHG